jgi:hypothetical protein
MTGKRKPVDRENKPEQDIDGREEDFLVRWSRRKLETQHADQGGAAGDSAAAIHVKPATEETDAVLTDADMPPIETLDEDSDYSSFLSPGVSDDLRHQAMRKLFAQPDFNITDGLNDYDEDYTQFAGLGKVITHEMKRMLQRELDNEQAATGEMKADAGQKARAQEPASDLTAAAETGDTDLVDTGMQNDDAGKNDTGSG